MPRNDIMIIVVAMSVAFLITFCFAPPFIRFLRRKKLGQQIRDDGPQRHLSKAGTPTMGGVVILAGIILGTAASWFFHPRGMRLSALLLALTVAVAAIGSIDDWGKIRHGRSLGLRAREKLFLQLLVAGLFIYGLKVLGTPHFTAIGLPSGRLLDLGWAYWPLAILFIAGMSNAVNLTDGLDGLAAGTTVVAALALAIVACCMQMISISAFIATVAAACLAFLWYNQHPARVFMGDTGSLAIGAAMAGMALACKQEVLLLLIGLIFLLEMFSVIIQVISFKTTGKRVFRMSPFHHHLELGGWSEPKIVTRAWLLGLLLAILGCGIFSFFFQQQ